MPTISRRDLVQASVGYALAASPITAMAVNTPATALVTRDIKIPTGKGKGELMPAYLAMPKGSGPFPLVLVVHEIFGVHEYIRDVCRRLAAAGYAAVSPSLYFRHGDATAIADISKLVSQLVSKVPQGGVLEDLDATVAYIKDDPQIDSSRVAITGFCWGGGVTWLYAARNRALKAGVAWYGRLKGESNPLQPRFPIDVASDLTVPVLGLYGGKDSGIPLPDVETMRATLAKGKSGSKIIVYDSAQHGFHADYRPSYHEEAARAGWQELLSWLKAHGMKP